MVFQKSNPFPKSIYENVAYGPRIAGERNRARPLDGIVARCSEASGVVERGEGPSWLQRTGIQRRAAAAVVHRPGALATDPEVLLDGRTGQRLRPEEHAQPSRTCILGLKKHYTIVIVTHNMQQAARVSDRTAFFFEGKLVESGRPSRSSAARAEKQTEDNITGRFG